MGGDLAVLRSLSRPHSILALAEDVSMALVDLKNVCVNFAIYNSSSRSFKKRIINAATGGVIGSDAHGKVIVTALESITFTLRDGDRVGLIGHNGAGKSTLLRVLSGVYRPVSGSAVTQGQIGSLIDISLGIDPEATGRENIFIRGALLGMSRREIISHLDQIIDFSELGDFIDIPVRTYSSGMHLRLAFSVSTILRPQILLMDEWLSVGDEAFKHKAAARMKELVDTTSILVVASHSRELIFRHCNRVIHLERGRIVADGIPSDIATPYFDH